MPPANSQTSPRAQSAGAAADRGLAATEPGRGLRTDIQALRALAVLLVVVYHLWPGRLTGGFVGVDIFFVISGFLITGHLLRDAGRNGRISLVQFWTRRAFRLLPASLLVIVLTMLAALVWVGADQWHRYAQQALGSGLYVQNWVLSATSTDYLSSSEPPTAFQHFWSLSIEEQFYLVLPVLLVAVLWRSTASTWRARFWVVLAAITGLSLLWSVYLTSTNAAAAYFVTTTRAWEFGLGALLAFVPARHLARVPSGTAWLGVGAVVVAGITFSAETPFPGYAALLPTVGAVLALATTRHDPVYSRIANSRPVQLVGDASYSIYLWHWPILVIAPYALGRSLGFLPRVAILLVSLGLGYLSMRFIEQPFRARGQARWRSRSGVVVAAGVAAVLAVGVGSLALVQHQEQEAKQNLRVALGGADPCVGAPALTRTDCPAPRALVPDLALLPKDDGNRGDCWASQGDPTVHRCTLGRTKGARVHAVAVGDSHNNALIPAYAAAAKTLDWRIDVSGKAGCYATSYKVPTVDRDVAACRDWRAKVVDGIVADPSIDVVIVTRKEGDATSSDSPQEHREVVAGLRQTWKRFTDAGKEVIVLQDVPRAGQPTLDCVARNGLKGADVCGLSRGAAFPKREAQREASQGMRGVRYVGVEDSFCTTDTCPAVIGGVPVFFNPGHVSKTFATSWGPILARDLRAATS